MLDANVNAKVIRKMLCWTRPAKREGARGWFESREPLLSEHVSSEIERIAGRMSMGGAPDEAVHEIVANIESLAVQVYIAMDLGHCEVWGKDVEEMLKNGKASDAGAKDEEEDRPF